ncbi:cytochrome P450 [Goodfellowiella coeruleoviolacea]|uniref:Cytochrome P450 n=1 Tax=Goodfellowiella coeruleoviolacea TaxID=334858 RepID=A0AAE3GGA2_9PSEU|nr:cytochrome P450 [Goodfellowiella coeruleoviolacea]MCP2167686.1 Cytochrome P450 [Goodfellowiella coeruleoviolacea]
MSDRTADTPLRHPLDYPFAQSSPMTPAADLARVRATCPVVRARLADGQLVWLVTRYADIRSVLSSPSFVLHVPRPTGPSGAQRSRDEFMLTDDVARHSRLRRLVAPAFSLHRVEKLRPRVRAVVAELLAALTAGGRAAELMESFALPLPLTVMCEVIGIPVPDRRRGRAWAAVSLGDTAEVGDDQALAAFQDVEDYATDVIAAHSGDATGVLGHLLRVHARRDGQLSTGELHAMVVGLLLAGYLTTASTIGRGVLALLRAPEQWSALRHTPALVHPAVEEILRYRFTGVEVDTQRRAVADVSVGGVLVRRGDIVITPLVAANRDPQRFDDADRFDIDRADNAHLAFGFGTHHCLGAALARIELQEAVAALVRTLPGLRLAVPADELSWNPSGAEVELRALPVVW